jgi:hypothetical protein
MKFFLLFSILTSGINFVVLPARTFGISYRTYKSKCMVAYFTWESVDPRIQTRILDKYFGEPIDSTQKCDIFCIEGIPAASLIYTNTTKNGDPIVDSFCLNKGLLLMFDAGKQMRTHLSGRYKNIDMQHAKNRNDFLLF